MFSFIESLNSLQESVLQKRNPDPRAKNQRSLTFQRVRLPQRLPRSLLSIFYEGTLKVKRDMGVDPDLKYLAQQAHNKLAVYSDNHKVVTEITTKNYGLRVQGDSDRALAIELLFEELMMRETCQTPSQPLEFTQKTAIVKILLQLEELRNLPRSTTFERKNEMISLPNSLALIKRLIAKRNSASNSGRQFSFNSNSLQLTSLTGPQFSGSYSFKAPNREKPYLYSSKDPNFDLGDYRIRRKVKVSGNLTKNYFGLMQGPLLNDHPSSNEQSSNRIAATKSIKFPIYSFEGSVRNGGGKYSDNNTIATSNSTTTSTSNTQSYFGGRDLSSLTQSSLEESLLGNLFSKKEGYNNLGKMNAFSFEGPQFKKDPYSNPIVLDKRFKPFDFGGRSDPQGATSFFSSSRTPQKGVMEMERDTKNTLTPPSDARPRNKGLFEILFDELGSNTYQRTAFQPYWEDIGRYSEAKSSLQESNMVHKKRCSKLQGQLTSQLQTQFTSEPPVTSFNSIRKQIVLAIFGVGGEIFVLDEEEGQFLMMPCQYSLELVTSSTLDLILEDYLKPCSLLFQLSYLDKKLVGEVFSDSFTRKTMSVVLRDYLRHFNQTVLDIEEGISLLDFNIRVGPLLSEVEFVHGIFFGDQKFGPEFVDKFNKSTDTQNLDRLFQMLKTLNRSSKNVEIVHYIMEQSLKPTVLTVMNTAFKQPDIQTLQANLKIQISKNSKYEFIVNNVPEILASCMQDVLVSAQNLVMIKKADTELFRSIVSWRGNLRLVFDPTLAEDYLHEISMCFQEIQDKVSQVIMGRRILQEEDKLGEQKQRLERLRELKDDVFKEQEKKARIEAIERFKKAQLNEFLKAQAAEARRKKELERQLDLEFEKNLLFENTMRGHQREKQELLREIKQLGVNIDDEIEELVKIEEATDQIVDLGEDEGAMEVEEGNNEEEKDQNTTEDVEEDDISLIEVEGTLEDKDAENQTKEGETDISKMKEEEVKVVEEQKTAGYSRRAEEEKKLSQKYTQATHLKELKIAKETYQVDNVYEEFFQRHYTSIQANKQNSSKVRQLAFEVLQPPLEVLFDVCISSIIHKQAQLTNSALMYLLKEKFRLMEVLGHFKKIFLCYRGDWADEFLNSTVNRFYEFDKVKLLSIESFFEDLQDPNLPTVQFRFKKKRTDFGGLTVWSSDLNEYFQISSPLPPPLNFLMTDQICEIYFQQFLYLIKIRHASQVLARLWKILHSSLPRQGIPNSLCRKLQLVLHSARDFANSLSEYIYHFVIEGQWKMLTEKMGKAQTFNNVFKFHADYISEIQSRTFASKRSKSLHSNILHWIECVQDFDILCKKIEIHFDVEEDSDEVEDKLYKLNNKFEKYHQYLINVVMKKVMDTQSKRLFSEKLKMDQQE